MSENKCCGNCAHSYAKDIDGYCACGVDNHFTSCDEVCDNHVMSINGWVEITPDNVKEIESMPEDRVVVGCVVKGKMRIYTLSNFWFTPTAIAMQGGYYYYVLPELKVE